MTHAPDVTIATDAPPAAIGRTVGRGATWMVLNTAGGRAALLASQLGLGWLLSEQDFGIYGKAIGLAVFVQCLRDGGATQFLIQRGAAEYLRLRGPVFWLAFTANCVVALALFVVGALAHANDPQVARLLWVLAVSFPFSTFASICLARLTIDLRFEQIARLQFFSAMIRYGGMLALAAVGMGPLSFVLPVLVTTLFEGVYGLAAVREQPWRDPAAVRRWLSFLDQTKWLLMNGLASGVINYGVFPILALLLSTSQVGVYVFATQLALQLLLMLAVNFDAVLFPALQRLNAEPERQREALVRALRTAMLTMAPLSLLLVAAFDPVERFLWHGRWHSAVAAVLVLSIFFPFRGASVVYTSALRARGRFRVLCLLELAVAIGMLAAACMGAALYDSPTGVAWVVGPFYGAVSLVLLVLVLGRWGVPSRRVLGAVLPSWSLCTALALLCLLLQTLLPKELPSFVTAIVCATTFGVLWAVATRLFLREHLRDALNVLPARLALPTERLFWLSADRG